MSRFIDRAKYKNTNDLAQAIADHIDRNSGGGNDVSDEPRVPKGSGATSGEWMAGDGTQIAIQGWLVPKDKKAQIRSALDAFTNGALTPEQLDSLVGQFIQGLSLSDALELQKIPQNGVPIEVTPSQKEIIQHAINKLQPPSLKDAVQSRFDSAVQSRTIICPKCTG